MLAILTALESEAKEILQNAVIEKTEKKPLCDVFHIEREGKRAILAIIGVGKVLAAMTTQYVLDSYPVTMLLNYGTGGGVEGEARLGETYLIEKCCQYDFDVSCFDKQNIKVGLLPKREEVFMYLSVPQSLREVFPLSSLATGDRFDDSDELVQFIKENFDCPIRDMEGGAIAQVAEANGVPLVILKGVSDYVGKNSVNMYKENSKKALDKISQNIKLIMSLDEICPKK